MAKVTIVLEDRDGDEAVDIHTVFEPELPASYRDSTMAQAAAVAMLYGSAQLGQLAVVEDNGSETPIVNGDNAEKLL